MQGNGGQDQTTPDDGRATDGDTIAQATADADTVSVASVVTPVLSIVSPTFNEALNIPTLVSNVAAAMGDMPYELIIVDDDSPDRTWEVAEQLAETDPSVRVLRRFHDKGLSPAVMAGMETARADVFAVIDADGQHDERILPQLAEAILSGNADVAVGSRAVSDGSYGEWSRARRLVSWVATMIAKVFLSTSVADPMSGFFAVSRSAFESTAPTINPRGFKILLEIIGRNRSLRVTEVGFTFRNRVAGETKLNSSVIRNYLLAVFDMRFGHMVKPQFLLYTLVGIAGVGVNLLCVVIGGWLDLKSWQPFGASDADPVTVAVLIGIVAQVLFTFAANNWFTFWEYRYRSTRIFVGFALYSLISLYGLIIQFSVAKWLNSLGFEQFTLRQVVGMCFAFPASYFMSVNLAWHRRSGALANT